MHNYNFNKIIVIVFTAYLKGIKICQQIYLQNTQKKVLIFITKLCND